MAKITYSFTHNLQSVTKTEAYAILREYLIRNHGTDVQEIDGMWLRAVSNAQDDDVQHDAEIARDELQELCPQVEIYCHGRFDD